MVASLNSTSSAGTSTALGRPRRVSLYGVGIVSPGAANLREFLSLIQEGKPALSPIEELQGAFLVGNPKFDFEVHRDWITQRHAPNKFSQLSDKGYSHVRMAVGTSIDALESNPGLEQTLKKIDPRIFVCYGSGFGDLEAYFKGHDEYKAAESSWQKFWAHPERNAALA